MVAFTKQHYDVDGVRVEVLEAGSGEPLVFIHGAGALAGFDSLLPLAESRRLIVPIHPGFGGSQDDLQIDAVADYAFHYAALFRQIGLNQPLDVIGHSLGGWIASLIAGLTRVQVRRLVLACPAGMRVPGIETTDLFTIPVEKLLSFLVADRKTLEKMSAVVPTNEMRVARYREMTSLARVIWDKSYDAKIQRWLGHIFAPTLILWGESDRILPVALAEHWKKSIAGAQVKTYDQVGHLLFTESPEALKDAKKFLSL